MPAKVPFLRIATATLLCLHQAAPAYAEVVDDFAFFEEEAQVVTASRRAEPIGQAPSNITVITEQEIRDSGAKTVSELLSLVPGVQITTHRKGTEKIWVRGVTAVYNDKTVLLIDGFPFKELIYGQHPIDEQLPLTSVKRIEVIKGPVSALYGANSLGGVINLVTREPGEQTQTTITAGGGSWNTHEYGVATGIQRDWGGSIFSGSFYDGKGDYHDKDEDGARTTRRDPNRLRHMYLRFRAHNLALGAYQADYNTEEPGEPDTQTRKFTNKTTLLHLQWSDSPNDWLTVTARSYYNRFDWRNSRTKFQPNGVTVKSLENTVERTQAVGVGLFLEATRWQDHGLTLGFDFENEQGQEITRTKIKTTVANPKETLDRFSDPRKPNRSNYGVFLEDHWNPHPLLHLTAGLRQDQHEQYGGQTSPRGALIVAPNKQWSAKLLYGKAFRAPSFRELYIKETKKQDDGNPSLKPEKIETVELDLKYSPLPPLKTGIALYSNVITDFITPDPATLQYSNTGKYRIYGLEPELRYKWRGGSYAFFNYTLLRARNANGEDMPDVATNMFNLGANARIVRHINLFAALQHVGRRNRASNYQAGIPASLRQDLLGAYEKVNLTLTTRNLPVEVSVGVYNLFDVQAFNPNYARDSYDVEHPGRSFRGSIRYAF